MITARPDELGAIQMLQRIAYFRDLGPDRLKALHGQTVRRLYRAKETIFLEGEPSPGLFWVERGRVIIRPVSVDML
ncbi:cyclic nucleotide-binding domain-containing protein [Caldinitratiruptor microaerophilus]|uniref:Cyclic nucleotide-binding domain-containing protein n=1 Tax=Caldinitratiruptor microaerophilus TaxID=671077 RepID=A0AA35CKU7_9FIRM|nr:hypothetical protein [Caldinitratiruptor microaerophilus]BDG61155.1 hypothetical protein caldi_22450 [Caldinitratiruptor microaerophilus]